MKLFICNKAGRPECGYCSHQTPRPEVSWASKAFCGRTGIDIKLIRYRHQLEVAILMEIAACRKFRGQVTQFGLEWFGCNLLARSLYRVLKAGRRAG